MARVILTVLVFGCSPNPQSITADRGGVSQLDSGSAHDPTAVVFAPDHLLDVRVEMAETDWDTLSHDGRDYATMKGCLTGPPSFPWQRFIATVTVDGTRLEQVEIRKKGFFGSLSVTRPSLNLVFDHVLENQRFNGLKHMTLNNNFQDASQMRQCLTYGFFSRAGLPAPRCNFAHLRVNGRDLGIYTHVESIKKDFLARHFPSNKGNLYEGQTADFTPERVQIFERKTNEEDGDRSDLDRVVKALQSVDSAVVQELEQVIDLEQFRDYWIMETLAAHWDSYSGNRNNFFVYHDPVLDRFFFIPWGTDGAFNTDGGFLPKNRPQAVLAASALTNRLYNLTDQRARYLARAQVLLDTVWNEAALQAQIAQYQGLLGEHVAPRALAQVLEVIRTRRGVIQAELDRGGVDWPAEAKPDESCGGLRMEPMSGRFEASWGTLGSKENFGSAELEFRYQGSLLNLKQTLSQAGYPAESDRYPLPPAIRILAILSGGQVLVVQFNVEPALFVAGPPISFHGFATVGVVLSPADVLLGFVSDGTLTLERAEMIAGGMVAGSFSGQFIY